MYREMKTKAQKKEGFTLIELLVVIGIIGILSTIAIANFIGVRERARDAKRKAEINQIKTALEFFKIDNNGQYPTAAQYPTTCNTAAATSVFKHPTIPTTIYVQKMPCDPQSGSPYTYNQITSSTYSLYACLENENDQDSDTADTTTCGADKRPFWARNP